jgi:hypothetical protein
MITIPRAAIVAAAMFAAACNQTPKEDPRVAELQKELAAVKKDLDASKQAPTGAAESQAAAPAPAPDPPLTEPPAPAPQKSATSTASQPAKADSDRAAREKAASDQAARNKAETDKALADQRTALTEQQAATRKQAEESARLKRELEEMKPREFTLAAGTVIPVRTTAELTTAKVKNGSVFDALLEKDLVVSGTTLAKAGSTVTCVVVEADQGGRVKGTASLSVAARSIAGVGGNQLQIKTESYTVDANSTKGRDAARTGIATGVGAAIGAIAGGGSGAAIGAGAGAAAGIGANMATRGKPAVIPTETLIEFALSAPATVVIRPAAR